jgi:hypothetical protein
MNCLLQRSCPAVYNSNISKSLINQQDLPSSAATPAPRVENLVRTADVQRRATSPRGLKNSQFLMRVTITSLEDAVKRSRKFPRSTRFSYYFPTFFRAKASRSWARLTSRHLVSFYCYHFHWRIFLGSIFGDLLSCFSPKRRKGQRRKKLFTHSQIFPSVFGK